MNHTRLKTRPALDTEIARLTLTGAAFALGQALMASNGFLTLPAVVWLTAALMSAGASLAHRGVRLPRNFYRWIRLGMAAALIFQLIQLLTTLPGFYIHAEKMAELWRFRLWVGLAGGCALLSLLPDAWLPRSGRAVGAGLALVLAGAAGLWLIQASPDPHIDTFMFQQTSSRALLQGKNPYELSEPNLYDDIRVYGPELVKDGRMTIGNPYPPLSVYLSMVGYLVGGDIRYSHLAAMLAAAWLMMSMFPGREARLAAYLYLFTPRGYFVLEQSWTEPLLVFFTCAVTWCALYRPRWMFAVLGLLLAGKQYMLFTLPLADLLARWAAPVGGRLRALTAVIGVALAVTAPLALWNLPAFVWNVGLAQFYQVVRPDALSYTTLFTVLYQRGVSQYLSLVILLVLILLAWLYAPRTPWGWAASLGCCLAIFFAFSKQAFCNYYYLVIGLWCCALAALPCQPVPDQPAAAEPT